MIYFIGNRGVTGRAINWLIRNIFQNIIIFFAISEKDYTFDQLVKPFI